jgi:hypothetical protein
LRSDAMTRHMVSHCASKFFQLAWASRRGDRPSIWYDLGASGSARIANEQQWEG